MCIELLQSPHPIPVINMDININKKWWKVNIEQQPMIKQPIKIYIALFIFIFFIINPLTATIKRFPNDWAAIHKEIILYEKL